METSEKIDKDKEEPFTLPRSVLQVKLKGLDTTPDPRSRKNSNTFSSKGDTDAEGTSLGNKGIPVVELVY